MDHIARKRFGQNFLHDESIIAAIIGAIAPQPDDKVVEIGPGLGALTQPLAAGVRHLHLVEIDRDLAARLARQFDDRRVTVHCTDVLDFDFSLLGPGLRVVGNLPYNISSPVLFRLARFAGTVRDIHVMLQKEVVERMAASPGAAEFSRLSVMLQYHFSIETLLTVPPQAFEPVPKVESAVARLVPLEQREGALDADLFSRVVRDAFGQRRKTLRNAWRNLLSGADFAQLGIDPRARAQELTVADFVRVSNYLAGGQTLQA